MKFIASLLICCIFLLSAFAGRVETASFKAEKQCCTKGAKHCAKQEHKPAAEECEKQGCNMLLTCSSCGFLAVEPVAINIPLINLRKSAVNTYISSNSAVYLPSDWKPPKV